MNTLLADLELVCDACDALCPPRAAACPRCHAPFDDSTSLLPTPPTPLLARLDRFTRDAAELVLLRGVADQGATIPIPADGATIGRTDGDYRFPSDPTLAPLAARFAYQGDRLFVRDEGAPAGVFIAISEQVTLEPGAAFGLGDHLLRHGGILFPPKLPDGARVQGAPFPGPGPLLRLEALLVGGGVGRVRLLPFPIRVGRREGEVILRDDRFVSARHCALYWDGEKVILEDLQSSNGTFVRLPPGSWRPLRRGDTLRLGRNIFRLR